MNSLNLIYKTLPLTDMATELVVESPNRIFKAVRQHIKPSFLHWLLKPNNENGEGAVAFNRRIGRFGCDWLDFHLPNFSVSPEYYPTNQQIADLALIRDTEIASAAQWQGRIEEEIAAGEVYLLVGLGVLLADDQIRMRTSGLPSSFWPCRFRVFELLVTNAPSTQFVRYRAHVLL